MTRRRSWWWLVRLVLYVGLAALSAALLWPGEVPVTAEDPDDYSINALDQVFAVVGAGCAVGVAASVVELILWAVRVIRRRRRHASA